MPRECEEGLCALCCKRPADYLGLVCGECRDAVERNEPWTMAHTDVLFELREREEDEEYRR